MTPEIDQAFPGIRALPTSFILDRESRVVQRHVGLLNQVVTEQETRALAGLPVNASIEEIDRGQPARLEKRALRRRRSLGVDPDTPHTGSAYGRAPEAEHRSVACGCENTLAKCRIDDPEVHDQPAARSTSRSGHRRAAVTGRPLNRLWK